MRRDRKETHEVAGAAHGRYCSTGAATAESSRVRADPCRAGVQYVC